MATVHLYFFAPSEENAMSEVTVTANGPLAVKGLKEIKNSKGQSLPVQETVYLCRCGHSANKPFCDGSHKKNNFIDEKI